MLPGGHLLLTMDNGGNPVVALRNALPEQWLRRLGIVPYSVGVTANRGHLTQLLVEAGFEVLHTGAFLHCPRVMVIPIANLVQRTKSVRLAGLLCRTLMFCEWLGHLPTRYLTGHFVAVIARRSAE